MRKLIYLSVLVLLLSACSQASTPAATITNPPPTFTSEPATAIPAPATETSAPQATPTEAPPTDMPTEAPTDPPASSGEISFANDVLPIIEARCIRCHGGEDIDEGLDLTSYAALMAGSRNGAVVVPGDADASLLVTLVESDEMPKRGQKLTPEEKEIFRQWVIQGAQDN